MHKLFYDSHYELQINQFSNLHESYSTRKQLLKYYSIVELLRYFLIIFFILILEGHALAQIIVTTLVNITCLLINIFYNPYNFRLVALVAIVAELFLTSNWIMASGIINNYLSI